VALAGEGRGAREINIQSRHRDERGPHSVVFLGTFWSAVKEKRGIKPKVNDHSTIKGWF